MGVGISARRLAVLTLVMLAAVALWAAAPAGAAKLVGKDGKVYACYKAKGKSKGAVRLVPKKAKCKRGEKKISWGSAGPAGTPGQSGENGSNGESGAAGETGAAGVKGLESKVQSLTNKVTALEGILQGITNTDLLGVVSKLQGISPTQLQEAVAAVANVKALCTQARVLTTRANELGGLFGGIELGGVIPSLLKLVVPAAPAPLQQFGC
ncbi:MAG: hypothetical protein JST59_12080 [Actinobacteria bacterium]|nr:hypothetical protein [Actinomycetota bacterium]